MKPTNLYSLITFSDMQLKLIDNLIAVNHRKTNEFVASLIQAYIIYGDMKYVLASSSGFTRVPRKLLTARGLKIKLNKMYVLVLTPIGNPNKLKFIRTYIQTFAFTIH